MVDYLIVGSTAMQKGGFMLDPKDLDIFYPVGTAKPKIDTYSRVEYHEIPRDLFLKFVTDGNYIDLESLYVLKLSHAEYNIHWHKTIKHLHMIKRKLQDKYNADDVFSALPQSYKDLFYALKEFWKVTHKSKDKITLVAKKEQFFTDKVKRKYDHDSLHEVVMYGKEPMYKKCLKDGQDVLLDEQKFNALTKTQKLQLCREEIYVIALERFLIPNNFDSCEHESYRAALKKVVTTMTKGWFPTFIVDNYPELCKIDKNYMKIFQRKVKSHG